MLFNSYPFIFVFLPITLLVFFGLVRFRLTRVATASLFIASLAFYAYWDIHYLPLMLISIGFNYFIGRSIEETPLGSKKATSLLWTGIGLNLALLCYYKYANFFLSSFDAIAGTDWTLPNIILPLGISFYTFTQTAYLVDAYRGKTTKQDWLTYGLFVTFFPHLIAGPILHHQDMIPQFQRMRNFVFSHKNMARGLVLFGLGIAKKVLIADSVSPWVAPVFNNAASVTFIEAWVGAISYTMQLYFDFSGYCDMAIGLGWMINIDLPINFNSPYKSLSIVEFWRRWHITLSNFLRDYLYIPLGGNRKGQVRRYINLMTTMLLGGLWHGAGWTYVIWGGLHGLYLCINHGWTKLGVSLPKLLAWVMTFFAVIVGWVIFRAGTLADAMHILQAMVGMKGIVLPGEAQGKLAILTNFGIQLKSWSSLAYIPEVNGSKILSILSLVGLTLAAALLPNTQEIMDKFKPTWWWAVGVGVLTSVCLLSLNRVSEFLYFQF
ncbi:MAG TPA: membrane-bound O-acyltransferase family protein [Cyanobacteria bacterium UBA11149]|nr:membrane-bound O-acyltransferase family protein [Cyanobacteria bacterium UBA11367]HBE59239.1 membrane-bound O-acyltransferase family protein [Cyanobacteria bacterium UBA11366]HBK62935.1 membrane-bound O-acyltransferase family protein [Cyanobacteria bacterium UBA11166]HBR76871.1 membrane-bound O-acyltransferase family protein [Cyanobacteria bacterium UBA11159]HBS69130.1 membrane-bound O-acyltransferase family protein [Cyanobacteria bacterium UBA11153]HBW88265.1 membrane-bound O-acyltransfera